VQRRRAGRRTGLISRRQRGLLKTLLPEHTERGRWPAALRPPHPDKDAIAVKRSALDLTLRVKDVHIAVREIEKRLARVNGGSSRASLVTEMNF